MNSAVSLVYLPFDLTWQHGADFVINLLKLFSKANSRLPPWHFSVIFIIACTSCSELIRVQKNSKLAFVPEQISLEFVQLSNRSSLSNVQQTIWNALENLFNKTNLLNRSIPFHFEGSPSLPPSSPEHTVKLTLCLSFYLSMYVSTYNFSISLSSFLSPSFHISVSCPRSPSLPVSCWESVRKDFHLFIVMEHGVRRK